MDTPQSALVGIAIGPDMEIVFDTVRSSRKYANLLARPACSFVVGWTREKTVQLEGLATEPQGADLNRYQEIYFAGLAGGANPFTLVTDRLLCGPAPMDKIQRLQPDAARDSRDRTRSLRRSPDTLAELMQVFAGGG